MMQSLFSIEDTTPYAPVKFPPPEPVGCWAVFSPDRQETAMKPIAIFVLVAAVSLVTVAASAKTVTAPGNTDERVISQVAGAAAAADASKKQVEKAALKKAKDRQKSAPHDDH
jgi:hypothetical protein